MQRDDAFLADIISSAHAIAVHLTGADRDVFRQDRTRHQAVIRELEIIGEATKQLSSQLRDSQPQVPWRRIAGLRDVLIHSYRRVELDEIWRISTDEIPRLIEILEPLLSPLE